MEGKLNMAEIQAVSTNNVPLNTNGKKTNNTKSENNKNITIPFENLSKEEQVYEIRREELITQIINLNEKMRGLSIANDAVIYDFTNEQLEKELAAMQKENENAIKSYQNSWWVKLSNKIDKFIDKLIPETK